MMLTEELHNHGGEMGISAFFFFFLTFALHKMYMYILHTSPCIIKIWVLHPRCQVAQPQENRPDSDDAVTTRKNN